MKTDFARLNRRHARLVLGLLLASILLCVAVSLSPMAQGFADKPDRGVSDVDLYKAVADRVRGGEAYYFSLSDELRSRGYPTTSFFNWRTPLPMWLIGILPNGVFGKTILCVLAVGAMLLAFELSAREGGMAQSGACVLLMAGGLLPCFLGELYVMPVLWAGALIALSVCAFGIGRPKLGVLCGILAVFVRDLAGPYCVLGLGLAMWQRRYREAALWTAGLAAYGIYFLTHCYVVRGLQTPGDVSHAEGWLQAGGAAFVISAVQMNGFLLVLPQWISAVYLPLALLGFASWSSPAGHRATLAAVLFVVLFSFIGLDFNQYWGSMIAPLLCLGAARAPLALRDLWRTAELTPGSSTLSTAGGSA